MPSRLKLFFDGGCRPNPGEMELAVVMAGHVYVQREVGYGTSMDAEWLALIEALRFAQECATANYILLGDSLAVIDQANGRAKCRGADITHLKAFQALLSGGRMPDIRYVKRSQNLAGIALAKLHTRY